MGVDNRCTQFENLGEGVAQAFAKFPKWGVKKNCQGGPPRLGFISFLLTSVLKFAWGGGDLYFPSPLTPSV
jgi:hypothetical protein